MANSTVAAPSRLERHPDEWRDLVFTFCSPMITDAQLDHVDVLT